MNRPNQKASSFFTLIELLVVIAIIAILASMLLPALGKARMKARLLHCISNGKQLGTFIFLYTDDNQGYYPPYKDHKSWVWDEHINTEYSKAVNRNSPKSPLYCPDDFSKFTVGSAMRLDYGPTISGPFNGTGLETAISASKQDTSFKKPAQTLMLPETAYGVNNIGGAPFVRNTSLLSSSYNLTTSGAPTFSQTRHASLCNVTWLDGHTTTQKGKRLQLWLYERCSTGEIYGAVVRQEYLN